MTGEHDRLAHFAVTIIGKDRPGIVAGAAEILYRLGCNIADSSCTMLAGEFAMILIVSHDKPFTKVALLDGFRRLCDSMGLSVSARPLHGEEAHYRAPEGELCLVTVYGSDQPGIVYRVTQELASRGVNITDLNTKLVGSDEEPVYVLMLEAALSEGMSIEQLTTLMTRVGQEIKVEVSVRPVTPVAF
ncbi:MAG TPA: ACT domain-containing protein [Geobacterales bacterium]|nr:ACT domain-containing protein [Geobacterales bacterium]